MITYGVTDVGKKRSANQDRYIIENAEDFALAVVCDGMGGVPGGAEAAELASSAYMEFVKSAMTAHEDPTDGQIEGWMQKGVAFANRAIRQYRKKHRELRGMGTTLVAVTVSGGRAVIANVGDSRLYTYLDGKLTCRTRDDSYYNYAMDNGIPAGDLPNRNVITKAVGPERHVEAKIGTHDLSDGEKILLCSDGLHGAVPEDVILSTFRYLKKGDDPYETLKYQGDTLVAAANHYSGHDNVTAVILSV